jgi:hypothetical protein
MKEVFSIRKVISVHHWTSIITELTRNRVNSSSQLQRYSDETMPQANDSNQIVTSPTKMESLTEMQLILTVFSTGFR